MKFNIPKNPNWEKYMGVKIEGEPLNPRCPCCETDGYNFGLFHVTKKWVYYMCFLCDEVFRVQRLFYKSKRNKGR